MRRRTTILLVLALVAAYFGSYLFYSRSGIYVPRAFGAIRLPDGGTAIASKGSGKIWSPFGFPGSEGEYRTSLVREISYLPLVFIDRFVWHRAIEETEASYLNDYLQE